MQMLGGFLILLGCFGMGLWYRQQFLGRLYTIRELIRILEQWISEIRYNAADRPADNGKTGWERSAPKYTVNMRRRRMLVFWNWRRKAFADN